MQPVSQFRGNLSITNNGISPIPAFSLGKPAVIFDMSIGGNRLSFDPEIRFSMDGKPWAFIWWWRYKIISSERLSLRAGITPSFVFREIVLNINGTPIETLLVQRYLTGEIAPGYTISKNIKVGVYYFHSLGMDPGLVRHTQFLTVNSTIDGINLSEHFFLNVRPQIIYLKSGDRDGYFTNTSFLLGKRNFPLSIGSIVNWKIKSDIPGTRDWVWNISLIYSFNKSFVRQ